MAGEFDFIEWVRAQQKPSDLVPLPAGDDLAVLHWPKEELLLVGVDQVLDGVHFDAKVHAPGDIGRKVMNRNLSDCAAMACLPAAAVVAVALPRTADLAYAKALYQGLRAAADAFYCKIVGGDTATWDGPLVLTVSILGRSAGIPPVTRSQARPGDRIYVTGPLGGSILGRHLNFTPPIHLARQIARTGRLTAMLDLSDGLSRDLRHICAQSHVGAILDADLIPIHPDAITLSQSDGRRPLEHALHDGEDHELLFTTATALPPAGIRIGEITADAPILLKQGDQLRPLEPLGWEHALNGQSSKSMP
jgi:thiamine-monophosphate kinase